MPLSFWIPAFISALLQGTLWLGHIQFLAWMDLTAVLWIALAGFAAASLFLVLYRLFATQLKSWSLSLVVCSLLQFCALGNSLYFVALVLNNSSIPF